MARLAGLTTNQDFRLSPPGAGAIHERVWHFHNAYSLLLPGDRHLAEDVSQEVFLRAFAIGHHSGRAV